MIVAEGGRTASPGNLRLALQWGRNMIVAEGALRVRHGRIRRLSLQWGRNMIVAEGNPRRSSRPTCESFNGAAT